MSLISIIKDNQYLEAKFLSSFSVKKREVHFSSSNILKNDNRSLVSLVKGSDTILKMVRPRSWHEYGKYLYGRSRISKELKGNKMLKSLGVAAPKILLYGYGFPFYGQNYLGFMIMENLESKGIFEAKKLFLLDKLSDAQRGDFFEGLLCDLRLMKDNRLIYSDLMLDNIFVDRDMKPVWIDTGVTKYSNFSEKKFKAKNQYAINRFIKVHEFLTDKEVKLFLGLI